MSRAMDEAGQPGLIPRRRAMTLCTPSAAITIGALKCRPSRATTSTPAPVDEAYKVPFKFSGKIGKMTIELKEVKTADRDEAERARKLAALKTQRLSLE